MQDVDITIVGAGIVGLATAFKVAEEGKTIVVLEKEDGPGKETSSRNSEVIHAGIYYPTDSLKARLCVEGASMLYTFCADHGVPFQKIGKVIVAAIPEEEPAIEKLYQQGMKNGVQDLRMITGHELKELEPHVRGACALFSPRTGILDSHRLIKRVEALCLDKGCTIMYRTRLTALEKTSQGFICSVEGPSSQSYTFSSRVVINSAGLYSDTIASFAGIDIDEAGYRIYPVKGEYFRLRANRQGLVNGLVYPSPEKNLTGLGIHVTKDLSGSVRLGPNARYVTELCYDVDPCQAGEFHRSAQQLIPSLMEDDIMPDTSGIRPKIQPPGGQVRDFVIRHEEARGLSGLINLIGIESPGLTSCLAIAKMVDGMIKDAALL
jgi:L-2-hydroxyglutarate oxidase LhgO